MILFSRSSFSFPTCEESNAVHEVGSPSPEPRGQQAEQEEAQQAGAAGAAHERVQRSYRLWDLFSLTDTIVPPWGPTRRFGSAINSANINREMAKIMTVPRCSHLEKHSGDMKHVVSKAAPVVMEAKAHIPHPAEVDQILLTRLDKRLINRVRPDETAGRLRLEVYRPPPHWKPFQC